MLAGAIPVTFEKNLVSVLPFLDLISWDQLVITLNDTAVASGNLFGTLKVLAVRRLLVLKAWLNALLPGWPCVPCSPAHAINNPAPLDAVGKKPFGTKLLSISSSVTAASCSLQHPAYHSQPGN